MSQDCVSVERPSIGPIDEEAEGLALYFALREEASMMVAAALLLGDI